MDQDNTANSDRWKRLGRVCQVEGTEWAKADRFGRLRIGRKLGGTGLGLNC